LKDLTILVDRLKEANITTNRFLKVNEKKAAFEKEWQYNLYSPEDLESHSRWGITGKEGLVLIDADNKEMSEILRSILPQTFEVISPRRKLPHFYIQVVNGETPNKTLHLPGEKKGVGEIRAQNSYLVCPSAIITYEDLETGETKTGEYRILQDRPIATMEHKDFMEIITPYLGSSPSQKITHQIMREGTPQGTRHFYGIRLANFLIKRLNLDYISALIAMKEWNKKNTPPMNELDLKRMVNNAIDFMGRKDVNVVPSALGTEMMNVWQNEDLTDYMLTDLEKRVKFDKATKQSVFATAISAYLPEPINTFLKGRSGIGKTYNVVETLGYFPSEDTWFLGGLSPKALIHDHGILLDKNGDPVDFSLNPEKPKRGRKKEKSDEEYKEELKEYYKELAKWREYIGNSYTLIDLSHKILVFLEAPEFRTFKMLLPILSHDKKQIEYKFTDKTSAGKLMTSKVIILGFPACIFLSTDTKYTEELATRSFTATPEASKEKIEEANKLTNLKASYPWNYDHETEETRIIKQLIISLKNRFVEDGLDIVVPFGNLHDLFPKEIVRDMRDFQHFTQFLKTVTALHLFQRVTMEINGKQFVLSTVGDVKNAVDVYNEIFETTRTGMDQQILTFYDTTVKEKTDVLLKTLTIEYNENHSEKKVSGKTIARWLERLSDIGYVDIQKAHDDKRFNVYTGLVQKVQTIRDISAMSVIPDPELEKGFKTWLKNIYRHGQFTRGKNVSIPMEQLEKYVLFGEKTFSLKDRVAVSISKKEDLSVKSEEKPESVDIPKMSVIVSNSEENTEEPKESVELPEGMVQCDICKNIGKKMFFANEGDLELHYIGYHKRKPKTPSYRV